MFKSRSKSHTAVHTGCVLHPCFGAQARAGCHGSVSRRQRDRCRADDRSTLLSTKKKFTHFNENIYISYSFLNKKKKDNAHRLFITFECIQIRLWTKVCISGLLSIFIKLEHNFLICKYHFLSFSDLAYLWLTLIRCTYFFNGWSGHIFLKKKKSFFHFHLIYV